MSFIQFYRGIGNFDVISTKGRNLFVETDFSSSYLRIRKNKFHPSFYCIILAVFILLFSVSGFTQNVKRVISLAPSITENIYLMGAQNKLVGCTSYCTQAVAAGVTQIGSAINVNIEKIFALQPDLVLTMQLTKPQDLETMKKLGLNVVTIPTPKSFDEICKQTIQIGKLIGSEKSAQNVIQETKQTVNEITQKSEQLLKKQKVFFQIGADPIFTVLQNTFMDDYILLTNTENIANGLTKGTITRESVLVKNPDVIIIATMGGFGKEEQKVWNNYSGISAVKNNKVFLIDSDRACSPTPLNFAKALEDVYQFVIQ